jgi:sugar lactone lactonase YvrE
MIRSVGRAVVIAAVLASIGISTPLASAGPTKRAHLDIRLFARVPPPGYPANVAVASDGKVFVGSYTNRPGDTTPSKVFAFSRSGALLRSYVISGQDTSLIHGVTAAAFDGDGKLYVLDQAPPRVLVLDPRSGAQRVYARLHDIPMCITAANQAGCSPTTTDAAASPDFAAFGPDGGLYITDFQQALIWKVNRGGGDARIWYSNPAFDGGPITGPAGIQFEADGRSLVVSVFTNLGAAQATNPTSGKIYALSVDAHGRPGNLRKLWESRPGDMPDGLALARSRDIYVALGGPTVNQLAEIAPNGTEIARVPATPIENALMPVPFDEPSGVTFGGNRLLVTNLSYLAGNANAWAVYDVFAGEQGVPLYRPHEPRLAS